MLIENVMTILKGVNRFSIHSSAYVRTDETPPLPAYNVIFNAKFGRFFQNKPNQTPPLGIRVSSDLRAVGFRKKSIAQSTTIATPPWLLSRPVVDLKTTLLGQRYYSSRNF